MESHRDLILFFHYFNFGKRSSGLYFRSEHIWFAIETIFRSIKEDVNTVLLDIENSQSRTFDWFTANQLALNESKTNNIIFSMRYLDVILANDLPHKFLSIWLDLRLTWEVHCNGIVKNLNKTTFHIRNMINEVSRDILKLVDYPLM